MAHTIIESVKAFIAKCPYLDELKTLNIDFLGAINGGYSIEEVPTNVIRTQYVDGE